MLNGAPLDLREAGTIALVWWCWASTRSLPGARVLAVLAIVKLALGGVLVDRGFNARYYANDHWAPPIEQSVEFRRGDITRRDARLAFGNAGQPDLPLYFLNDLRFNYYRPTNPERHRLAYSIRWNGFIEGARDESSRTFYLVAPERGSASLIMDDAAVFPLDATPDRTATVSLGPGWHALEVRVKAPYGAGRAAEAGEVVNGVREPFDGRRVVAAPVAAIRIDAAGRWASRAIDLGVLTWLGLIAGRRILAAFRERRVGQLLWLAAIGEALWVAWPYAPRVTMLSGGDDWLTYEYFSREIALGDPLLARRRFGGGQGGPFYYQPLYPYFLTAVHLTFGESLWGVVFAQRLLLASTIAGVTAITRRLFGVRPGWIALVGGAIFLYAKGSRWTRVLLAEPLFMALLVGWIWWLVRTATEAPAWARVVLTGMVGGVASLARSTLLLGWPLIVGTWSVALRAHRVRATSLMVAIMITVVATATVRNWVVTHTFVPVTTGFGINLYLGNEPPPTVQPAPVARAALYERLKIENQTRAVIEYAVQAPGQFVANLERKALYTMGLFDWSNLRIGETGTSYAYVGMWCAALVGVARLLRSRVVLAGPLVWLPLVAAVSHFLAVVLIFPYVYGDRLILPLYPLLLPYAALAMEPLISSIWSGAPGATSFLLATPDVSSTTMAKARMHFSDLRMPRVVGALALLAAVTLATLGGAYYLTREPAPEIRIGWRDGIEANRRAELERHFRLVRPAPFEDRLTYDLLDTSRANVKALVNERDIQDTDRVDREHFAIPPDVPYGSSWMWIAHRLPILRNPGVVEGTVVTCAAVLALAIGAMAEGWRVRRKLSRS